MIFLHFYDHVPWIQSLFFLTTIFGLVDMLLTVSSRFFFECIQVGHCQKNLATYFFVLPVRIFEKEGEGHVIDFRRDTNLNETLSFKNWCLRVPIWICGTGFLFTIAYIKLISYPIDIQHCFRVNMTGHFTGHTANGSSKIAGKPGKGGKRMNTKRFFPFNTNIVLNNFDLFCWCLEWTIPFVCCLFQWFSQFFFRNAETMKQSAAAWQKDQGCHPKMCPQPSQEHKDAATSHATSFLQEAEVAHTQARGSHQPSFWPKDLK